MVRLIELTDDEVRRLYWMDLIDGRTNRDAIHGRGPEREQARERCAPFVHLVAITVTIEGLGHG